MPRNKDLKRLVRGRMDKTGESYSTARAQITKKAARKAVPTKAAPAIDYATLAGKSDAVIKTQTGRDWTQWTRALDRDGAAQMRHRDIATLVHEKYEVRDWWAQTVTVGYERIKGLRSIGQRRDGLYEAAKSRTFTVPVATLFDAFANARTRKRWLPETVKVRTAAPPKTMRIGWDDGTIVVLGFTDKGKGKSAVAVQHGKLADRAAVERMKKLWGDRFDALAEILTKS
jgi:uncharacterized protein YndB with AHSA1/START domain